MGCSICGSSTKSPNSAGHIKTKMHQSALGGGSKQSVVSKSKTQVRSTSSPDIVNRISDLEKQMRYVIGKLSKFEEKLTSGSSRNLTSNVHSQIKSEIMRMTRRGSSMSLDDLANKLSKYRWETVEKVILEMVDDEHFDVAESYSKKKINGRYGRIIRR